MSEPNIQVDCQMQDGEGTRPAATGATPTLRLPHAGGWAVTLQQDRRPVPPARPEAAGVQLGAQV